MQQIFDKKTKRARFTEAELREEAAKYQHRSDFHRFSPSAYQAARDRCLMEDICSHMTRKTSGLYGRRLCANNAVYIWQAMNAECEAGLSLYKIGKTTWSRGIARIDEVATTSGMDPRLIVFCETDGPASVPEQQILAIGKKQFVYATSGSHEFRLMTTDEIRKAVEIAVFYSKTTAQEK